MKTRKINSARLVALAFLTVILFSITACNNKKSNPSSNREKPKPPAMDINSAAYLGNTDIIHRHINAGSDLNKKDDYGSTPLHIATVFGKTEVAIILIEAGADINVLSADGSTPLHNAAFFCRTEIVEALLKKGAEKDIRNSYGSTALESVAGPFEDVKAAYEQLNKDLGPLGLKLDFDRLEKTRPVIAEMLR
jgi:ankyrin repeat protein